MEPEVVGGDGASGLLEAVFKGTHTGPLNAPSCTIPATGKTIAIPFVITNKAEGGTFISFHLYFDQMELMAQLG